jgi:VWFA-related protein
MRNAVSASAFVFLAATLPQNQTQPPPVRSSAAGILMDVTVLDKDGHPVTDLKSEDFELTEDGKPQQIVSATLMSGGVPSRILGDTGPAGRGAGPQAAPATAAGPVAPNGPRPPAPTVTAILFDSLSANTRPFATRAAAAFVSTLTAENEYAGVFLGGLGLTTIQKFTNRTADLRRAIDRVAMTASNNLSPEAERTRTPARTQGLDQATPVTAGAEYASGAVSIAEREARLYGGGGADPSEALLTRMELRMEEGYSRFLAEYEGDSSLSGLRAAVTGLALLPGRKSILYFTEELPITSRLQARFNALIGEANAANIAIYPVDAAGLRVHSKEAETARGVNLAGAQGVGDANRGDGPLTRDLEKQSETLSSRPAAALGRLANETGGFVIDNTNDLAKGVARMQIERTTYYLLGYQPTNTALDGKFHRVTVKVKRGKVTVRARPGYVALCCPPR